MKEPVSYKKKTPPRIEVKAMQLQADNVDAVANWCKGQIVTETHAVIHDEHYEALNVKTPNGRKRASRGSYIVLVGDNFFVVQQGQFDQLYDKV